MTAILDFYFDDRDGQVIIKDNPNPFGVLSPHPNGYTHWDIVRNWTDHQWENRHDFIQWIFPLKEVSAFNPDAPLLTDEDIACFRSHAYLRDQCFRSFHRFMRFLGLRSRLAPNKWVTKPMLIDRQNQDRHPEWLEDEFLTTAEYEQKQKIWQCPNHNWLRITRSLHSLRLLGLEFAAESFFDALCNLYDSNRGITTDTFRYWQEAAQGGLE